MKIKHQNFNDLKKGTDLESLTVIKNTRFTEREIDIIACFVSGRSYKKTASILSISPKTVEFHMRNIMSKVGCNSRESVIDFIEKSNNFTLIKAHYINILVKTTFNHEIKKLLPTTKKNDINCLIFHNESQITKTSFIHQLEQHLNAAGIKTFNKIWVEDKSESFLVKKMGPEQINCIIYVLSNTFVEQLEELEYKIDKEASSLIPLMKDSSSPVIFLLSDERTFLDINKNQTNFAYRHHISKRH